MHRILAHQGERQYHVASIPTIGNGRNKEQPVPANIAMIGAGSGAFARKLVNDMLFFESLADADWCGR